MEGVRNVRTSCDISSGLKLFFSRLSLFPFVVGTLFCNPDSLQYPAQFHTAHDLTP